MYFPCFYMLKEVVNGTGTTSEKMEYGLSKYKVNYAEDLVALWKLWVPSTIINFAFMPMHLRIPWVASTSLIWTCILSYMRGDDSIETSPEEAMNYVGGQAKQVLALYDIGVAAKPAYLYDSSKAHLLVTATGRDRIGFIKELSDKLSGGSANVLDAKMYKVGRECAPPPRHTLEHARGQLVRGGSAETVGPTLAWMCMCMCMCHVHDLLWRGCAWFMCMGMRMRLCMTYSGVGAGPWASPCGPCW